MKRIFSLKTLAPALLACYTVLRLFHNQFENDELQHLHVVWSWTRGLVQYKDIFDNHAPLYHLLAAGALYATGAKASSGWLILARFLSLPVFAALLAAVYRIARDAFGLEPEEALMTACLLGLTSPFLAMSARPEPLWLLFFFLSLLVFSGEGQGARSGFLAGLVNGAGAMVSLKTLVLLLPAQALGAAASRLFYDSKADWEFPPAFLAGLAVVPSLVILYFRRLAALRELFYYTVTYNSSGAPFHVTAAREVILVLAAAAVVLLLKFIRPRTARGMFFYISAGLFLGLLLLIYPVMEHQTVLPFRLMAYALAAALLAKEGVRRLPPAVRAPALFSVFCALLLFQLYNTGALKSADSAQKAYIDRILALTGENDYVMDAKGESVFRRRPFYYGLELLAMRRMAAGEIADDIPERARVTDTRLVLLWFPSRFTRKDLDFFRDNYLPLDSPFGALLAAGKVLTPAGGKAVFDISIPADYAAYCEGAGPLSLDGRRYTAPVHLDAGRHTASSGAGCGTIKLVWAKAAPARPA